MTTDTPSPTANRAPDRWPVDRRVFALAALMVCLLHGPSFVAEHLEGDEVTYLVLAQEMTWTLQHYTTAEHPATRDYPYAMYRDAIFGHPPLLPLILKVGFALGHPERLGLLAELAAHLAALGLVAWLARHLPALRQHATSALLLVAACPFLGFSTTRLHTDGLLAVLAALALAASYLALRRPTVLGCIVMAVTVLAAMSVRYTGILVLPIALAAATVGILQARRARVAMPRAATVAALLLLALAIGGGLIHFIRVWQQWGTWRAPYDADLDAMNDMLTRINARPRSLAWVYQLWIAPVIAIVALPVYWRTLWHMLRRQRVEALILLGGPAWFLFAAWFTPLQLRYYAPAYPLIYLAAAILPTYAGHAQAVAIRWLCILTVVSGGLTSVCMTWVQPISGEIVPWPFIVIPGFFAYYN